MQEIPNLDNVSPRRKDFLNIGFAISIHVLRAFYTELINKCKNKKEDFIKELDEHMPEIEHAGSRLCLNNKEYSLIFKKCSEDYDLNREINKVPNLGRLSPKEKETLIKQIDVTVSSVWCVNKKYTEKKEFLLFLKNIFDELDNSYKSEESDKIKDIELKIDQFQRTYRMSEDKNSLRYGIHVDIM